MQPIIFDFNGTMFLDTAENEIAWRKEIKNITGKNISDEEFTTFIHGSMNEDIIRHFMSSNISDMKVKLYSEEKEMLYRSLCLQNPKMLHLTPGLVPLLNELRAKNVPINIATSSLPSNVEFYFKQLDLARWFSRTKIVYNDGSFPGKPSPAIYLKATRALGLQPEDCIVVEDSISGIKAASNAGVKKIIAIASTNSVKYLTAIPEVTAVIKDFHEFKSNI
ncbi:MAG: HAD family phosphatase [Acidaminococcaceae bacterium]|nr:HAD family phosphatase [Acidaminococcaceae bacterium]